MAGPGRPEELELSAEEAERLQRAFRDERFRALLADLAGSRRCYLNICSNPHELGRAGRRRFIYDVVFHPAALRVAARSARFRRMLSDAAMDAVESRFAARLDRTNASVLRGTRYKGDYRCGRDSAPGAVPRELVVTVELPLLRSAAQAELEIRPRELLFESRRPAYRLRLPLPYHVDESAGRAVFEQARRRLLDGASLSLLLPVPGIQPHSLSGEVAANRYSLRFSSGAVSYSLVLQFPASNRLAAPETAVSVGAHNAVIALAKAAGSSGLWEKYSFGLDASALQERWFVSEENVDGFLRTVLCPSSCTQSELEAQTLIEVLDVSEDSSQIRLKPQEAARSERGEAEEAVNSSGGDVAAKNDGDHLQTKPETERTAAGSAGERPMTAETIGEVDGGSQHCLQQEPSDTGAALPGKPRGKEQALDEALAGLGLGEGREGGAGSPAASPVLQEVGTDGSVQSIAEHRTHCAIAFQNSVLYELD
ncbi:hypothetical protein ASZ78_001669 [Callipepla squamata]|uniref:PIH1D1/2/3 CS-like domain-containing protein n=1 Tax=Callipepla squamata TaxID=9009 RepID=A0A226N9V3_CALSU|nr:hypothetical protein ASZ78_001669 [Callipepla squamata]